MTVLGGAVVGHIHGVCVVSMVERALARARARALGWSSCARSSLQWRGRGVGQGHSTMVTWHGREHGFEVRLAK
eukprot:4405747-Amphidinium_carterae.1